MGEQLHRCQRKDGVAAPIQNQHYSKKCNTISPLNRKRQRRKLLHGWLTKGQRQLVVKYAIRYYVLEITPTPTADRRPANRYRCHQNNATTKKNVSKSIKI